MDYQSLHMKTVADLRKLAKTMGVKIPAGTNKSLLIEMLLEADKAASAAPVRKPEATPVETAPTAAQPAPRRRGRPPKKPAQPPEPAPEVGEPAKPVETVNAEEEPVEAPQDEIQPAEPPKPEAGPLKPEPAPIESPKPEAESPKPEPAPIEPPKPEAGPIESPKPAIERETVKPESAPAPQRYAPRPMNNRPMRAVSGEGRGFQPGQRTGHVANRQQAYGGEGSQRPLNPRFAQSAMPANPQRLAQLSAQPSAEPQRREGFVETGSARGRREGYYNAEYKTSNPAVPEMLTSGECSDGAGVLEIQQDGYGFLRADNCQQGPNDVYISIAQIRRFNLRMGDYVEGKTRPQREGDRYSAMLYITSVNGRPPEDAANRPRFEELVPIYPDERIRLETPAEKGPGDLSLRLVDMLAPIGKGQRGMIVSQPKAGKTTLLKKIANAITAKYPDIKLIVLLIDERPEEVTDMKRSIEGEVIYSTFDEAPENHVRVSEMVLERAQRLVEMGQDVVVLMDSITRLARAYNLVITPTGRSLSGGLDPGALFKPKRFFGAARNIENGGSLTVIATALVETGSRMDDIIFEEFKGTGNMELHLDRKLSDKRVFPAIDMLRSGTRREELLLTEAELEGEMLVRRVLSAGKGQDMVEEIIGLMSKTATNADFFTRLRGWLDVFEKDGYTLGGKQ